MLPSEEVRAKVAALLAYPTKLGEASPALSKEDRVELLRKRNDQKPPLLLWNPADAIHQIQPERSGRMGTPNGRNGHCPAGVGEAVYLELEEEPTEIETWWDEYRSDFQARRAAGMCGARLLFGPDKEAA